MAAHHAPNGRFRNPWPNSEPPRWLDVPRMLSESWRGRPPSPLRGAFPVAAPSIVHPRRNDTSVSATWIGHSTVLLQLGGLNVITDPVFCQRAFPVQWLGPRRVMDPAVSLEALPPLDVVVLSHNHYDHLDRSAVKAIARKHSHATWVVPLELGATIRRWGARQIVELDWWQEATIGDLRVTATPARHMSARCGPFDFVMIPIGAYEPRWFMQRVHVDPEEAVRIYQDLMAAHPQSPAPLMLAIHWGTFRLTTEAMDEPPRRTAARWQEVGLHADRLWIARFGETRSLMRDLSSNPPRRADIHR